MEEDTLSRYIIYNNSTGKIQDKDGNVINGGKVDQDDYAKGIVTILRFRDGYLDGDTFNDDGTFNMQLPAVESPNHLEYWRHNKLHRDNGLPAIISGNPPVYEYWENGERKAPPKK